MSSNLTSYEDLVRFISALPASSPYGGTVPRYNSEDQIIDPRVAKQLDAQDALYIFEKYQMSSSDRRKIIAAILNVKIME